VSNAPRSTVSPASSAISIVRSIGKPYVSWSRNASAPPIVVACILGRRDRGVEVLRAAASVRRNVASSARA
jgi:hypothetical protein